MKILTSRTPPSTKKLAGILKREFSDLYTYKLFGLEGEKSIIVCKSTFVGVQISKRENEITIEETYPSITTSFFSFLFITLLGGVWAPFFHIYQAIMPRSPWRKLKKEIGYFLNQKYN